MAYLRDALGYKLGSTEVTVLSTDGKLTNVTLSTGVKDNLESGSTGTALKNYGVSTLSWSTDGQAYTLAAPVAGADKTIVLQSTAVQDSTAVFTSVDAGAEIIYDNSTTYAPKRYIGFQPPFSAVHLKGLSTALWGVISVYGGTKFSTATSFSS